MQKFYELTIKVLVSSYVTFKSFLDDIVLFMPLCVTGKKNSDVELNAMATRMKDKFDKYWENVEKMNIFLYVASVLNPRKKLEFMRFCFLEMYVAKQSLVTINNVKK